MMKPIKYKYLYRALSLVGISVMSVLLIGTTGASAHDQSQFNNVTNSQNQTNDDGNNDNDNGNDDNNNNNNHGGGGYIPGGNTSGGSVNNNGDGGISAGGATAGAKSGNGGASATVAINPNNSNSPASKAPNATTSSSTNMTKQGSQNSVEQPSPNNDKAGQSSQSSTPTSQKSGAAVKPDEHSQVESVRSTKVTQPGQFSPENRKKARPYKTTWKKGQRLDKGQRREVGYMKAYYKYYSAQYPDFHYAGGGDCTNWSSQLAHVGGYNKTSRGKETYHIVHGYRCKNPKKWYAGVYRKRGQLIKHKAYSTSWTTVGGFWHYFTHVKKRPHFVTHSLRRVMAHVRVGDVVQFLGRTSEKHNSWFHTVTISKVTKHMVYYTSHDRNVLFKPLVKAGASARISKYRVIRMGI
ncbi:hypothetical protein EFM38_07795 [Lentilactobacillus buchneri]|uniref:Uncharacterized protein n=3 Tax=Lentilactobacillus buchneri TaxID=1581 RepID=J9W8I6_LENBU|nr:hypothetical protein LBUCD034_2193 [Lentilactobacillus buchneri subsp. silagei CD034]MCT2901346.1 hypothetical protein [Lentilactobacillus buchneri]MCT3541732.1 hypothetical protein [Lentilactobacillus buchneri]MCT3543877.1 hypothetical protein [Lentilactobacillus buchneri]MCT3553074.1 hypothetical protein [Lentilactobacillus buchneri]